MNMLVTSSSKHIKFFSEIAIISIAIRSYIYNKEKTVLKNETYATHMHVCFETLSTHAHFFLHIPRAYCLSESWHMMQLESEALIIPMQAATRGQQRSKIAYEIT